MFRALELPSARRLTNKHKAFLARLVEAGPIPAVEGVVRWWACDLIMRLHEEFGISVSDDTVSCANDVPEHSCISHARL